MREGFIGRKEELSWLEEKYNQKKSQLLVVYGRRRIGKTETLREFAKNKNAVYYTCTESSNRQQLESFSRRLLEKNKSASKYLTSFSSWEQAFESLTDIQSDTGTVIIIDEFPYMVKGSREIPSILQMIWDEKLRDSGIMIILCGSSMSFIENEILGSKNPLYGRATGILKMREMNFYDAIKFLPEYTAEDKITAYAILGGIPHYLKQFDPKLTLRENILRNILQKGCVLYSEAEFLMHEEFRETAIYNTIITAIALGSTKLSEIHDKTLIEKTKLTAYLRNLTELGIVSREFPVSSGSKESANVSRGLYKITDKYFGFYYRFVYPNLSELESGGTEGIFRHTVEPNISEYTSRIFEYVAVEYLRKENNLERLPFYFTKIGHWWNKTDEVDVMAVNSDETKIIVGECKYRKAKTGVDVLEALRRKIPDRKCEVYYYLFSRGEFTDELIELARTDTKINLVGLEEIVN